MCAASLLICFLCNSRPNDAITRLINMFKTTKLGHTEHNKNNESSSPTSSELASDNNQGGQSRPSNVSEMHIETARDSFKALGGADSQRLQDALPEWAGEFCGLHDEILEINGELMAVAMLATTSGFITGHVTGDASGTLVPSNLQIMVSAPRSGGKSRAFDATTAPLYEMQNEAVEFAKHMWVGLIRPQIILLERQIAKSRKDLEGTPSELATAAQIAAMERKVEILNQRPENKERYIIENSTGQARNMMLAEAHRNAVFFLTPDARANFRLMLDGRPTERETAFEHILRGFSGDPLIVNRVTENLRREAPHQWMASLLGVQPDLAEKFWSDPLLRRSGVHTRVQCFQFGVSNTTGMRQPDDSIRRTQAVWRRYLTQLDQLKRKNLNGPPVVIRFTPAAIKRVNEISHPFTAVRLDENSLQSALTSRWREVAVRWALNLEMMKYQGAALPEVGVAEIAAACTFLFRAHQDALIMAGQAAQSPDQAAQENIVRFLADNGGKMALTSGNPLGLSIANIERIVALNPEKLRIAPLAQGGRGRPKKHVLEVA